jgi:hypothetical protein
MDRLRQSLPPEPALGSGTLTTLRVTFPGGVKAQRRFHSSDTLQVGLFSLDVCSHRPLHRVCDLFTDLV